FGVIATILGRSAAATKMLASRARGRIRLGAPAAAADAAAREVIDAFYAAAGRGDLAGLLAVLAPGGGASDARSRGDPRRARRGRGRGPGDDGRARTRWGIRRSSTVPRASSSR